MAGKDVDLIIRARDRASATATKVSTALKTLAGNFKESGESAGKANEGLGKLGGGLAKLQQEADRLKGFGKLVGDLNKSEAAFDRMQRGIRSTTTELGRLSDEHRKVTASLNELRAKEDALRGQLGQSQGTISRIRQEQDRYNQTVRQARADREAYNAALKKSVEPGAAQRSAGVFLRGAVSEANADLSAFNARQGPRLREAQKETQRLTIELRNLRPEIKAAADQQHKLGSEAQRTATNLRAQRADMATARGAVGEMRGEVERTSRSLGGMAASLDAVTAAEARLAAQSAAARARIQGITPADRSAAAPVISDEFRASTEAANAAVERQRRVMLEAKRTWVEAQAEVKRLAQAMRATTAPTEEMGRALGESQARARNAKTAYEQAGAGARTLASAYQSIHGSAQQTATSTNRTTAEVRAMSREMRTAAAGGDQLGASLRRVGDGSRQSLGLMQRLRGEVLSLTASYLGLFAAIRQVGEGVNSFRALEAAQNRLGAVFNQDTRLVDNEIAWLRYEADRLGISFGVLADEYGKLAVAADASNFSLADTRQIFTSVAEAGRVNKLSMDQMSGVFLALQQMISKGKVSSEELRRQLGDRLTGAFNIFANAIGMTAAQLDKAMQQGEVFANRSTMLKFADELTNRFGPQLGGALDSLTTDLGRLDNDLFNAQLTFARGFIPALREALQAFHAFASSREGHQFFTELGTIVGRLLSILPQLPQHFGLIKVALAAIVAVKLGSEIARWVPAFTQVRTASALMRADLAMIGPQMQSVVAAQTFMGRGFTTLIAGMDRYRAGLQAQIVASGRAGVSMRALNAGMGVLRGGVVLTTGAFRALWLAIGGWPGAIITGILLFLGNWLTGISDATAAITEHERQVEAVRNAYFAAQGDVELWGQKIREALSLPSLEAGARDLESAWTGALRRIAGEAEVVRRNLELYDANPHSPLVSSYSAADLAGMRKLIDLIDQLRDRTTDVATFREELTNIYQTSEHEGLRRIAGDILSFTDNVDDSNESLGKLEERLKQAQAALGLARGEVVEAAEDIYGLSEASNEVNAEFAKSELVDAYTAAIQSLKEQIPSLAAEMKNLKEITDLNTTAWTGLINAFKAGDIGAMAEIGSLWLRGAAEMGLAAQNRMLDSYGAGDSDVINRIIYVEGGQSGGGPSTSSARGIGQFIDSTWLSYLNRLYPELQALNETQKLALRTSEEHAMKIMEAFTRDNQAALLRGGVSAGPTETYLAHFLGAGDAVKVLLANPEELAANIVNSRSVAANPSVFKPGMTVADLINWSGGKMGGGSRITGTGSTEREDNLASTDREIAQNEHRIAQQALINQGKEREAAIEDAIRQARENNPDITDEQLQRIREQTAALYDMQNATNGTAEAEERVNQLYAIRTELLKQLELAKERGETGKVEELKARLVEINGELSSAIDNAIAMWQAVGGAEADVAITKMQTMKESIRDANTEAKFLGLTMQQWGQIGTSMADGLVGMIDRFAEAVANGEDMVQALWVAFLQFAADFLRQIATMILRQMILNALQGFFPGMGATGHTGGVVGSNSIGSGNRLGRPAWAGNLTKYHGGGIIGLKPDEMNATLRVGEEVLTEDDPRHRNNLGGESEGGGGNQALKQVLVLDPKDLANAMASKAGEKVFVTMIKNNAPTVRKILGM